MKQNSSVWIVGIVIILIVLGIWFLVSRTPSGTYTPAGTSATSTDTTGTNTTGGTTGTAGAKPVVTTSGFASVSSTTAVVVGTVIPNGARTTYWFEYGPSMSYGSFADTMTANAGYKELGAAAYITGLKPGTEYYFRIAAENAYGRTYGAQYKFITTAK